MTTVLFAVPKTGSSHPARSPAGIPPEVWAPIPAPYGCGPQISGPHIPSGATLSPVPHPSQYQPRYQLALVLWHQQLGSLMAAILPALPPGAALAGDPKTLPPVQRPPHRTQLAAPTVCRQTDRQTNSHANNPTTAPRGGWQRGSDNILCNILRGLPPGGHKLVLSPRWVQPRVAKLCPCDAFPHPTAPWCLSTSSQDTGGEGP